MALTYEELKEELLTDKKKIGLQKCAHCGIPLQETITGNRKTAKGHVCSDCYFELLGNGVETHPILMPRSIHGV